jgi:hypothetical protein
MKKSLVIFLGLLACFYTLKAENLKALHFVIILTDSTPLASETYIQKKRRATAPFQGKKTYCSYGSASKYIITIRENNVLITSDKIKIKGIYTGDRLLTNDPGEIEYRKLQENTITGNIML